MFNNYIDPHLEIVKKEQIPIDSAYDFVHGKTAPLHSKYIYSLCLSNQDSILGKFDIELCLRNVENYHNNNSLATKLKPQFNISEEDLNNCLVYFAEGVSEGSFTIDKLNFMMINDQTDGKNQGFIIIGDVTTKLTEPTALSIKSFIETLICDIGQFRQTLVMSVIKTNANEKVDLESYEIMKQIENDPSYPQGFRTELKAINEKNKDILDSQKSKSGFKNLFSFLYSSTPEQVVSESKRPDESEELCESSNNNSNSIELPQLPRKNPRIVNGVYTIELPPLVPLMRNDGLPLTENDGLPPSPKHKVNVATPSAIQLEPTKEDKLDECITLLQQLTNKLNSVKHIVEEPEPENNEVSRLKEENKEMSEDLKELEDHIEQLQDEIEDLTDDITDLQKELMEKNTSLNVFIDSNEALKSEINSLKSQFINKKTNWEIECEVRNALQDDLTETVKQELRLSLHAQVMDEVSQKIATEMAPLIKEKLETELKESLTPVVTEQLRDELTPVVTQKLREELAFDVEMNVQDEVEEELREEWTPLIKNELREELIDSIRNELKNEMRESVVRQLLNDAQFRKETYNQHKDEIVAKIYELMQK